MQWKPTNVMADGCKGITAALPTVLPGVRRLMCWYHAEKAMRRNKNLVPAHHWTLVREMIGDIQCSKDDSGFQLSANLALGVWRNMGLHDWVSYFKSTWIDQLPFWYEGASALGPSTNNGLESINSRIKKDHTLR